MFLKLVKPFYLQVFLEEYKTIVKEKEVTKNINKYLENYSDSDESNVEQTLKKNSHDHKTFVLQNSSFPKICPNYTLNNTINCTLNYTRNYTIRLFLYPDPSLDILVTVLEIGYMKCT